MMTTAVTTAQREEKHSSEKDSSEKESSEKIARPEFPPFRFYERELPEVGEIVVAVVREITPAFVTVALLEYGDLEGSILLSELSRKRLTSVSRITRIGKTEFCIVNAVSENRGRRYVDLSKKHVTEAEEKAARIRFSLSKQIQSLVRQMVVMILEQNRETSSHRNRDPIGVKSRALFDTALDGIRWVYERVIWPTASQFGCEGAKVLPRKQNPKLQRMGSSGGGGSSRGLGSSGGGGLECSDSEEDETLSNGTRPHLYEILRWHASEYGNKLDFPGLRGSRDWICWDGEILEVMRTVLAQKFRSVESRLTAEFEITSLEGVEVIRKVLVTARDRSPGESREGEIQITLISSPRYALSLSTFDRELGVDLIRGVLDLIRRSILEAGGTFALIKSVSDSDPIE